MKYSLFAVLPDFSQLDVGKSVTPHMIRTMYLEFD